MDFNGIKINTFILKLIKMIYINIVIINVYVICKINYEKLYSKKHTNKHK